MPIIRPNGGIGYYYWEYKEDYTWLGFSRDAIIYFRDEIYHMITPDLIEDIFSYHKPTEDQLPHYKVIRAAAKTFAHVILKHTPSCASQTVCIRKLSELVMDANKAIALRGKF